MGKWITFISLYLIFVILQLMRHILIVEQFKRPVEVILNKIFGRIFLSLLGVYQLNYKYQKHHPTKIPNIIFSSQSSIIDWMVLLYNYSPKFLWIVKSNDSQNVIYFVYYQ